MAEAAKRSSIASCALPWKANQPRVRILLQRERSTEASGPSQITKATAVWPPTKQQLTIRLDADVLAWLKANGRGYQTRISRILRAAMESQPATRSHSAATRKKH